MSKSSYSIDTGTKKMGIGDKFVTLIFCPSPHKDMENKENAKMFGRKMKPIGINGDRFEINQL